MTQNEPIFFPFRHHQTLVLNNNISICLCMLFAMTSKVWKKKKNFTINRIGGTLKKNPQKAEDLPLYRKSWQVCYPLLPARSPILTTLRKRKKTILLRSIVIKFSFLLYSSSTSFLVCAGCTRHYIFPSDSVCWSVLYHFLTSDVNPAFRAPSRFLTFLIIARV